MGRTFSSWQEHNRPEIERAAELDRLSDASTCGVLGCFANTIKGREMKGCEATWLKAVVAAVQRFQTGGRSTIDDLGAELSHLAWADCAPTAITLPGARDRFRRHPIAGASDLGFSALLMYWPPGHATLPHDHGGFGGIEVVLNGTLHVEEFVRSGSEDVPALVKSRCVYLGIGDVAVFDSQRYVHRCRNLSNTGPTLTLNVYGGALERYTAFETGASGVVRAQPTIALSDGVLETRDGGTRRLRVIYAGETGVLVAETTPTILPLGQHDREVNMVRRTRRWRKPPPKVLSLPTSQRTELCYAFEGKAHHQRPLQGERVELLLIDQERCTRWVNSPARSSLRLPVDEDVDGWRVLGWRLPSGDLRHGDYDVVDPELADFDRLPVPNTKPYLGHSSGNCLAEASPAFRDRD